MALLGGVDYVCPINFMYPLIFHLVVDMAHVHQYNFSNLNEVAVLYYQYISPFISMLLMLVVGGLGSWV